MTHTFSSLNASLPETQPVARETIPEHYRWNLTDIFSSTEAWRAARDAAAARLPGLARFRGHLGETAVALWEALDEMMTVRKELTRVYCFASMRRDEDTRVSFSTEMLQSAEKLMVDFGALTSFLRPEILALPKGRVDGFLVAEPRLKPYRPMLDDILRWKPYTLGTGEERIMALAAHLTGAGDDAFDTFTNAELPYPDVVLSTGETVRLDAAAYARYRTLPDKTDRRKVFEAFWSTFQQFRRTCGATLHSTVKAHLFQREARGFNSCLGASLFHDNIPVEVYHRLLADVRANLPVLHRYLYLRRRMLGLERLEYFDLYPPLVANAPSGYTPERAMELTLAAFHPLGEEYVGILRHLYEERWVDFLPSPGKRSGAYSNGAVYDVHPYQLLNFNGKYDDVSTLAHESGHSLHSYLSNRAQPYATHDYSIFVAEVASTLNENLLYHHMLERAVTDDEKLFLLGNYLDLIRGTLFRQTMFADFELQAHQLAEQGEALTGDTLNALYLRLLREYHGHAAGACHIDELYAVEWAYIPHFYRDFYVYQYSTSLTASTAIANALRRESASSSASTIVRDAYLRMLSAGSSKYPMELLRDAGVDMTTPAPFTALIREMVDAMDQIESILNSSPQGAATSCRRI